MKKALITGITGQDGSYLAELLLKKNPWYSVYGLIRRTSQGYLQRIEHLLTGPISIKLIEGDVTDPISISEAIKTIMPDEVYNLAAQTFVGISWMQPYLTTHVNAIGTLNVLDAIRKYKPDAKFYQASTSEMFGNQKTKMQNEDTPFKPCSPYGISKLYAHWMTVNYRKTYNIHASSGILFNHESPRRGLEFVTRKVSHNVARIKLGLSKHLELGNLSAKRDWGYAKEYVDAMWRIVQQDKPDDYVIATGETHTIEEMVGVAFSSVGLNYQDYININNSLLRPDDINALCGDASKAKKILGWTAKTGFKELIEMMVYEDMAKTKNEYI